MEPESPLAPRPFLFLHIRKTAGCSVRSWLLNRFPAAATLLDCHHIRNQSVDPSSYQFIAGHVAHDYLARFRSRPFCFVVLRQPIDRALSAYYFFRRNEPSFLKWLQETIPARQAEERMRFTRRANELSLLEFLEAEPYLVREWLGNVQTRALLNQPASAYRTDREQLDEALENLAACEMIGLTEQLGQSLGRLALELGWEAAVGPVPHENVTAGRPRFDEVPVRAREILAEQNQLDLSLYAAARDRFDQWRPPVGVIPALLPAGSNFTFDQPLHGNGWYVREQSDRGWFCWMGRGAWLDLGLEAGGDRRLELHVAHVLGTRRLDGLQVRVNEQPVAIRVRGEGAGAVVEATVPAPLLADTPRVRLALTVREATRPCDLVPGNPDTRLLGVAFDRIRLVPISRAA